MKGWLDNFGKADNANDSNVSLPEGFVGLGYNTKGRNYSPAWGGQFQDGGELIPIAQSGKFIPSSLTQQVQQAVQPTVKPTATVPYLQTKDPAEFYKSWIQSPEYEQRLKATGYGNLPDRWLDGKDVGGVDYTKQQRLDLLENIKPFEYNKYKKSEAKPFDIGGPTININPLDYEGSSRQSIEAHEIAHVGTPTMSYQESEIIRNSMLPMAEPKLSGVQGSKEREASKSALEDYQHSQKPEEVKADLDALRFMMYDKGIYDITKGQKFTESDFEKAKQNLGKDRVFKRLENRMGKKNFVKLMNTIASADSEELPMAMGGMSIPGSVGFTYARTASSAPSKGKYAKKTMASAQIGKNIEKDETNIDTNIASKIAGLELQQNPEYQYLKYLQGQPQLNQAPGRGEELIRQGLGYADVATDVMQMGNFIPLPQTQTIGKIGNIAGSIVDLTQAAMAAYNKDYQSALINAASAGLPFVIKNPNILGGYNRSAKYAFGNRSSYLPVDKRYGRMTEKQLLGNRALLGILGAETAYDAGAIGPVKKEYGGEIPSAQKGKNDIERISINDPRYPEMYKNRQVGLSYDGTISLPALDEVTITAPRSYTMDSLRDFTSAALYGAPATAMKLEAIPQAAMTETIEMLRGRPYDFSNVNPNIGSFSSNQRDLSQTLGYENPEGFLQNAVNLGLSAIDPVIISGASKVAGKQLAKKAVKAVDLDDVAKRKIHLQKLKDEKLIHPDTDINRYSKSLSDTEELTKKALTQRETYYRGVTPKIPEGPEQQLIIEEMTKAGVDISNPEDVGRYMATHVPFQKLDYNAGFATNDPRYNALYTSGGFSRYGDMTFEMTRPLDFSKGSYSNWLDELYKYPVYNPSEKIDDLPLFTRAYALENRPGPGVFVGTKGQKIFDDARLITDDYGRIKSKPLPGLEDVRINEDSQLKIGNVGKTNVLGEVVNRSITPIGYDPFTVLASPAELLTPNFLKFKPKTHATKNRLDAWRLYNGLEPNYNTFSKNADNTLSINDFRIEKDKLQSIVDNPKSSFGTIEIEPEFNFGGVHGNGLITKGVDEQGRKFIDFTDTWDLQPLQPIKGLPKKLKEFEVSSLTGGQPFDLKNRIYYDDAGNFFDHNNNKLIEKVESFSKGVVKENEPADVVMLTTPKIADEKQMDVLKDWNNAQNQKYIKGAGVGAVGTLGGLSYINSKLNKKSKEGDKSEESKNEVPKKQNGGEMKFYQNGLDWKPKSMQNGGEEDFIGKATKFVSEGISGPATTVALGLLNMIKPISNPEIYKTVRPVDYPNALKLPIHAYNYLMGNESEPLKTKSGKPHLAEEFWATAMGMPVERQYLKDSKYKPSVAKDPNAKYYTIRDVIDEYDLINLTKDLKPGEKMEMNGLSPILDTKWYSENANTDKNVKFADIDPLQRFTLEKSPDGSYVSIYDKYDFNNPALNKMMKPIEIYDRFYLPKKRKGGVIKDNRGQWAHPGEVTEIDSNYITMEGVPYDVVGVSDTGDTKLMKPGKNYKFKGKKVTEYPVAELGINQLDAQPMKKLNQLLNFTNNPDKDNWLDKYN